MRIFIIFLISIITLGCSTSATIYKKDGTYVEATILNSDSNNIYVDTFAGKEPIKKSDITAIDHPGNVVAVVGVAALGLAGINAFAATQTYYETQVINVVFAIGCGITGLSMIIGGLSNWNKSKDALIYGYRVSDQNSFITPQVYYANNKPSFGLNLNKRF
jgi:hypothetical protein